MPAASVKRWPEWPWPWWFTASMVLLVFVLPIVEQIGLALTGTQYP